jgi:alkanesulfonate monooxygenase SsuD/methylene tetrahydromethanopterin reductase-like flavin-dependent oxidoreductase (luciferase family)
VSFHLFLPQMRMPLDAIVERACAAEAAGFEGMALMDHLAPPMAAGHDMWEAMTAATWLLARTERLVVGHLVLCDALRHPAVLARQAVTLDHASGGRFELGIGSGSVPDELDTFGVGMDPPRERVARLGETLDVLRALWTGEPVDHDGRFFRLHQAQQRPVPTRRIPIIVGGIGRRTLELVRTHADWWNVPVHEIGRIEERRPLAGDARISVQTMVALVPSEAERAEVAAVVDRRFGRGGMGMQPVVGTVDELADHFGALRARGVERFYVWFADFAPPDTLTRFADVIDAAAATHLPVSRDRLAGHPTT